MDTINEQEPVGEAEFTPSPDTSESDTQPVETTEESTANVEETGEAEAPLLAGKYKTPEELEKAYSALEGKLGEQSQKAELANILEKQTGMNAQQIRDYLSQQEQAQLEQRIADDPSGYALQEVQQLKAQLALKEEQAQLDTFLKESPEFTPFKDKILNLGLNLERDKSYAEIANEYFGQARAQGQQDAYKKIETKTQSQTTGVKSAPQRTLTEDDFKNMSVAEMEAILPHADMSNRL